jgi:predicted DNA-binding transcriptional regulator AlpA
MGENDRLITRAELGEILSCSETTLWRRVKSGALPKPMRVAGLLRWRLSDISKLVSDAAQSN